MLVNFVKNDIKKSGKNLQFFIIDNGEKFGG